MPSIPAVAFAAYSGTGKTTLIEKVVRCLKGRGLRLAVIKHDAHDFDIDHEGKDTWRFTKAGSDITIIGSATKTAIVEQREHSVHEIIDHIEGVNLILVEGYKNETLPVIGICREATGKGFTSELSRFMAIVTDRKDVAADVPCFGLEDIEKIADFIMEYARLRRVGVKNGDDFTHFNEQGRAKMVDVGDKAPTKRTAVAGARVLVSRDTFELIRSGGMKKGDVLTVAQIAGVMGAKRTPDLIPMCHPIMLTGINLELKLDEARCAVDIRATVSCDGKTGVEMEALTAASTAALTVYDMCKAVQKDMVITDIRLITKTGGVHGDFHREEDYAMKYTAAVITISDKGARGEREDKSGPMLCELAAEHDFDVVYTSIIPDERGQIAEELRKCCDELGVSLVLTTGGTGFSPRDITPEATTDVVERLTPGIPELMRMESMKITPRGCLSRSAAGIRNRTLIINLPGSPKAAKENVLAVIEPIKHGLDMLASEGSADCAAPTK